MKSQISILSSTFSTNAHMVCSQYAAINQELVSKMERNTLLCLILRCPGQWKEDELLLVQWEALGWLPSTCVLYQDSSTEPYNQKHTSLRKVKHLSFGKEAILQF